MRENCTYGSMRGIRRKTAKHVLRVAEGRAGVPDNKGRSALLYTLLPPLVGASRKRIVKKLTGAKVPGKDLAGSLAIAVWSAVAGASVVRVHDVLETVQALRVVEALKG